MAEDPLAAGARPQPVTLIHGYTAIAAIVTGRTHTADELDDWIDENWDRLVSTATRKRQTVTGKEVVHLTISDWFGAVA